MENFNLDKRFTIGNSHGYYKAKGNNTIAIHTSCNCGTKYYQLWKPDKIAGCEKCSQIKDLKKRNAELESENEKWKEIHEDFIDKSQNWHEQQLVQKDEEIEQWKTKFENLKNKLKKVSIYIKENESNSSSEPSFSFFETNK